MLPPTGLPEFALTELAVVEFGSDALAQDVHGVRVDDMPAGYRTFRVPARPREYRVQ